MGVFIAREETTSTLWEQKLYAIGKTKHSTKWFTQAEGDSHIATNRQPRKGSHKLEAQSMSAFKLF